MNHPKAPVLRYSDSDTRSVAALLARFGLRIRLQDDDRPIEGSYWGGEEAGLVGRDVVVRAGTPGHSNKPKTARPPRAPKPRPTVVQPKPAAKPKPAKPRIINARVAGSGAWLTLGMPTVNPCQNSAVGTVQLIVDIVPLN